jgi:hypothetical protein
MILMTCWHDCISMRSLLLLVLPALALLLLLLLPQPPLPAVLLLLPLLLAVMLLLLLPVLVTPPSGKLRHKFSIVSATKAPSCATRWFAAMALSKAPASGCCCSTNGLPCSCNNDWPCL